MATGLDGLLDFLLSEIALCGVQGTYYIPVVRIRLVALVPIAHAWAQQRNLAAHSDFFFFSLSASLRLANRKSRCQQ